MATFALAHSPLSFLTFPYSFRRTPVATKHTNHRLNVHKHQIVITRILWLLTSVPELLSWACISHQSTLCSRPSISCGWLIDNWHGNQYYKHNKWAMSPAVWPHIASGLWQERLWCVLLWALCRSIWSDLANGCVVSHWDMPGNCKEHYRALFVLHFTPWFVYVMQL